MLKTNKLIIRGVLPRPRQSSQTEATAKTPAAVKWERLLNGW